MYCVIEFHCTNCASFELILSFPLIYFSRIKLFTGIVFRSITKTSKLVFNIRTVVEYSLLHLYASWCSRVSLIELEYFGQDLLLILAYLESLLHFWPQYVFSIWSISLCRCYNCLWILRCTGVWCVFWCLHWPSWLCLYDTFSHFVRNFENCAYTESHSYNYYYI